MSDGRRRKLLAQFSRGGGVYVPADQSGLLAVWDPSVRQGGQLLYDMFGGHNAQLGSAPGSDANDPAWQQSPPALVYASGDYSLLNSEPRSGVGEASYTVVFRLDVDAACFLFGSWYTVSNYPFWAYYNGSATPWLDWRSLIGGSTWTDRYDGGEGMTAIGTDAWHTMQWSHKDANNSTFCVFDGVLVETGDHLGTVGYDAGTRYVFGSHPKLLTNSLQGQQGPILLYGASKTVAELQAIHNDIAVKFPAYGLAQV
jgi:hypothetical protein